jgi:hypothetical protein
MGADPDPAAGHLAQHGIELRAVPPVGQRINPDHHPVTLQQTVADGLDRIVEINNRFGLYPDSRQRLNERLQPVAVSGGSVRRVWIASPHQSQFERWARPIGGMARSVKGAVHGAAPACQGR